MSKEKLKLYLTRQSLINTIVIILAFALLVFLCSWFLGNNEKMHIMNDAKSALDTTELNIISDFEKLEKVLVYFSETVREVILQGGNFNMVSGCITHISDFMFADENLKMYTTGIYGYFDVFGGKFHDGTGWQPPKDYDPTIRPWYKAAIEANGGVGITDSYFAMAVGENTLSFARRIFDDKGKPLGMVCLDVLHDKIRELAVNTHFSHSGYGVLLNSKLEVLAHPDKDMWGKHLREISSGLIPLEDSLKQGKTVIEQRLVNYKNEAAVMFFRQIKNGWYIGVVIPENAYYRQMRLMRLIIILLGIVLTALFVVLSLRLYTAKKEVKQYANITKLSPRELEICNMLLNGKTPKDISFELKISYNTVASHQKNIYGKLEVQNINDLLVNFRPA